MMDLLPHEKQIHECEKALEELRARKDPSISALELDRLEKKLVALKKKVYQELSPWDRIQICRHPSRPHSIDYVNHICDDFVELFGDRLFADDHAVIGGFGRIGGLRFVVLGQEKGDSTEKRMYRNFGMPHPEGFRKALRLMRLAEKFHLPVVSFIDTTGAFPGLSAEERGQSWAIAENLREMSRLKTPIIVMCIGEAASGGALAVAVGDVVGMLEHAYYSVITPEGCASILWKDASQAAKAAEALKLNAEDALSFGIVDEIIEEPTGGAHLDKELTYQRVKEFIVEQGKWLQGLPEDVLIERRYLKYRKLGKVLGNETSS